MELEIKNSRPVTPKERIRFQCARCGECCRHVKGTVVLDSLDGYRLAKHFGMRVDDFLLKYGDYFILDEGSHFPLYTLSVTGPAEQCIFLEGNRCTVRDARPGTCRMYPFWVEPTGTEGSIAVNYCYERKHRHEKGNPVQVDAWIHANLDPENKILLNEDFRTITTLAPMLHEARRLGVPPDWTERLLLHYRYLNYDTDMPFVPQFIQNNANLFAGIQFLINECK